MLKNTANAFGSFVKVMHWLTAVLVIGMLIFGFFLESFSDSLKGSMIALHKSIGLTILLLIVLRLIWRIFNKQPGYPLTIPKWEQFCARSVHYLFYIILIFMPATGWLMSSLGGHKVEFWNLWNWQLPLSPNRTLAGYFFNTHKILAFIIIGLLVLHVAAALKHHFIEKNNLLRRMLPGYKPTPLFDE